MQIHRSFGKRNFRAAKIIQMTDDGKILKSTPDQSESQSNSADTVKKETAAPEKKKTSSPLDRKTQEIHHKLQENHKLASGKIPVVFSEGKPCTTENRNHQRYF
jgi:hypothetical protein